MSTNNGRHRIDWEKKSTLPESVTPAMLQQWCPSNKAFRDLLDAAIEKWQKESTDEQKERVATKKRKQSSTATEPAEGGTRPNVVQTPPATHLMMVARAGVRTGTSTMSLLSSRSANAACLDRHSQQPCVSDDAAPSDDDCSVGASSARSSLQLESDSDDGSDVNEEDNACKNCSDDDDEDNEEFR